MNRRPIFRFAGHDGPASAALSSAGLWKRLGFGVATALPLAIAPAGVPPCRAQDAASPPGTLYSVADTTLHVTCAGTGSPAVVFESGLGGNYLDWTYVQTLVASRYKACAYDRAGAGWSGRTTRPRTVDTMAEELHLVTIAAHVLAPFILVGHSFGGLLSQNYIARYPEEVAGLVLVDSMHPEQFVRFAAAGVDVPTDPHAVLGRTPAAASAYGLPTALRLLAIDLASAGKARVFVIREMSAMLQIAGAVDAEPRPLRPARVLVHGNGEWNGPYPDGRMEAAWRAMQDDLARRFGAPPVTVVPGSGHEIPLDAPDAVVNAIDAVALEIASGQLR